MKVNKLTILYKDSDGTEKTRCFVDKWTFQDRAMSIGGQYITFNVECEVPIPFSIGDYCVYRGVRFYLNNTPSVTQSAKPNSIGNAFKYDSVRFDSVASDLGRVMMLDITATTGDYIAALGTNFTGSSIFQLFCGETTAVVGGKNVTFTPVCTLAGKIQANLDRAFPNDGWKIHVNLSTVENNDGTVCIVTHSDDKVMSFNNTSVASALSEVNNTFDLDYFVKGRDIYIGYTLGTITGEGVNINRQNDNSKYFYFGYGKGYADIDNQGKALFEIKKTADQSQEIITRLRAMGSIKNMPYRYYNKKYNLSQSLFPHNLQLPDTFEVPSIKAVNNAHRKKQNPLLRSVLGDTNDAYIDKNDDCMSTGEGLREGSAQWDGSNPDLEEIYPTIKGATYGELRAAKCADMDNNTEQTGSTADSNGHKSFLNYEDQERIDEILAVGYIGPNGELIDDAHRGDGIMPEINGRKQTLIKRDCVIPITTVNPTPFGNNHDTELFTIKDQNAGEYTLSPSYGHVWFGVKFSDAKPLTVSFSYQLSVYAKSVLTGVESKIGTYTSDPTSVKANSRDYVEFELPKIPDVENSPSKIGKILLSERSDVRVVFKPIFGNINQISSSYNITYFIGKSTKAPNLPTDYKSEYIWDIADSTGDMMNSPFHVIIKDMGFDLKAQFVGNETPKIVMSDGFCVAREFEIGEDVTRVTYNKNGKRYKGYQVSLTRASDQSIHVYYPSNNARINAGDHYVLIGIEMPDVFVKAAEMRLLSAATQYLADNCETKYTYEPHIDDIYLARNYDLCEANGNVDKSVYWNLYAGLKFPFYGIPETSDKNEVLPIVNVTIKTITIKEGEGIIPKIEVTLNDDIEKSTYQKITTVVDRIYNGSIFGNGGKPGLVDTGIINTLIRNYTDKHFLSKLQDDTAKGLITFLKGLLLGDGKHGVTEKGVATLLKVITDTIEGRNFEKGILGNGFGMWTDADGRSHVETDFLTARIKMVIAALEIMELNYVGGNFIFSPVGGRISSVKPIDDTGAEVADGSTPYAFRCYMVADDGSRRVQNKWKVGDQAKCQTFDLSQQKKDADGVYHDVENKYYWRLVLKTGQETLSDGKLYNYIDLANTLAVKVEYGGKTVNGIGYDDNVTPSVPETGDSIVQMGSQTDKERRSLIVIRTVGDGAPAIDGYSDVNDYNLASHHSTRLFNPEHNFIMNDNFEMKSYTGATAPMVLHRGSWQEGTPYGHYESVTLDGSTWLCTVEKGKTTTERPSDSSSVWQKYAGKGEKGDSPVMLDIYTDKGNIIRNGQGEITLSAIVTRDGADVTAQYPSEAFSWTRDSGNGEYDAEWNNRHRRAGPSITVRAEDIWKKALFECVLDTE